LEKVAKNILAIEKETESKEKNKFSYEILEKGHKGNHSEE